MTMPLSHSQGRSSWGTISSEPVPCFSGIRSKRSLEFDGSATTQNVPNEVHTSAKRVCLRDSITSEQHYMQQETLPGCLNDSPLVSSSLLSQTSFSNGSSDNRVGVSTTTLPPSMLDSYHNNVNNQVFPSTGSSLSPFPGDKFSSSSLSDHNIINDDNNNNNNNNNNEDPHLPMDDDDDMEFADHSGENNHSTVGSCSSSSGGNTHVSSSSGGNNTAYSNQNCILGEVHDGIGKEDESQMNTMETESNSIVQQCHSAPVVPSAPQMSSSVFCGYSSCRGLKPSPVSGRPFCHCYASWRGMYGLEGAYFNDYY